MIRRLTRPGAVLVVALATSAALVGCDQAQSVVDQAAGAARQAADSATADAATAAIGSATTAALGQAGITLVSPPDCTGDLTVEVAEVTASGTVTCVARTTERKAVRSVFEGSLTPTSCVGSLRIEVQGREPIVVPAIDGCRIDQIVGGSGEGSQS
jgi:Flp pilus assembly protein TadG